MTPILSLPRSSARYGVELLLKDEALLPTGSFKARGAAVAVSRARELGIREFALPTNGNAGGAWAAYGARAGMHAHVVMPRGAPRVNRLETIMTGADVSLVDGTIADAGKIVAQGVREHGWFDASTLKEPYRIEGKKTIGFELAEQLGWSVPDVIVYPTGGGVGLIGIDKALREFAEIAFGINVPKPLGDALILRALRDTKGTAIAVDDAEILAKQRELSMDEGIFVCPEGGATLAAVAALRVSGWIAPAERVLLINTGAGVKYPDIPYEDLE
jgi:threonine synthase